MCQPLSIYVLDNIVFVGRVQHITTVVLYSLFKVVMTIAYPVTIATVVFFFSFNVDTVFTLPSATKSADDHPFDQNVFTVCHLIIRESYASSLTIFNDLETIGDDFIVRASTALNTSWFFVNQWTSDVTIDHAGLIATSGYQRMSWLLTNVRGLWDSTVYYVWLMPTANHSIATELFKLAWAHYSVINVILLTFSEVYTYNPFTRALTRYDSVDERALRTDLETKIINLHRYPVRISMFPTKLKAIAQEDGTYRGYDGFILSILSERMNFTPVISRPVDGKFYGWREPNGTYFGALADIVNGVADIAFNSVLLKVIFLFSYFINAFIYLFHNFSDGSSNESHNSFFSIFNNHYNVFFKGLQYQC